VSGRMKAQGRQRGLARLGDVRAVCADIEELAREVRFLPHTRIELGAGRLVRWYCEFDRA
jgi:hypothetical protein